MPYYARDTPDDRFSRSSGPFAPSRTPGMRSYFRPGSSSRGSEGSSSSSSSTLPSPLSHSSFANRYSRPLPRTFEHDTFETNVAGVPHIRQTNGTNVNAVEAGKLIDHADISSRKMYARERSRYESEMRPAPSSMYTDPAIYHQLSHDYDSTARSPYSSTSQHYKRLRYTQPSLSTPPPSSPHEHQRTSWRREQYLVDMETDEVGMEGPCEIVVGPRASSISSFRPSKLTPNHRHRRTQSSPFSYSPRAVPFSSEFDQLYDHQQARAASYAYSQRLEDTQRLSDLPAQPPRTASSVASSAFLEHVSDRDDMPYPTYNATSYEEVEEIPDNDSNFALSPVRRRISFSTSAERDTPFIPNTPISPSLPSHEAAFPRGRPEKEHERGSNRMEGRLSGKKTERRAEEMLPTPPMSSPELELAQPLPHSPHQQSQPTRREPSIPVGSVPMTRERKRKERPTLMDLLSSPQPSVSPERPPMTPSSFVSQGDLREQENLAFKRAREGSCDTHTQSPRMVDLAQSSDAIMRDSLPPSSPFTSPSASPVKSSLIASPSPSTSPAPIPQEDTLPYMNNSAEEVDPADVARRSSSRDSVRSAKVSEEEESLEQAIVEDSQVIEQLPTPSTPITPGIGFTENSDDISTSIEQQNVSSSTQSETVPLELSTPETLPLNPPPQAESSNVNKSPSNPITTIHVQVDIKDEHAESDVEMSEVLPISAPSSPLSEVPSPAHSQAHHNTVASDRSSPGVSSDSEDELPRPITLKKRKVASGSSKAVPRKKTKVNTTPPVTALAHSEAESEEEESGEEAAETPLPRSKTLSHKRDHEGSTSSSLSRKKKAALSLDESEDEDDEHRSSAELRMTPEQANAEAVNNTRPRKGHHRRVTSPPMSSPEPPRSPSPQRKGHTKTSRARSKSNKPLKDDLIIPWHALSPLPVPELEGMLIETLATSRATSLSVSALWDALVRTRPALKTMGRRALSPSLQGSDEAVDSDADSKSEADCSPLNKREWLQLLTYILAANHLSSGVFGRVESSASDSDSRSQKKKCLLATWSKSTESVPEATLQEISRSKSAQRAQWFYIPEKDVDQDRANLVRSMMRGPGKRSETMKYKRYYWKPLGKISRWDREDDL